MYRQMYGIGNLASRQKYGFGDFVRKIIPNELSDIGSKAAPIISLFNPALGAAVGGISEYDKSGSFKDALKSAAFDYVLGQAGQKVGTGEFQKFNLDAFKPSTFSSAFKMPYVEGKPTEMFETIKSKIPSFVTDAAKKETTKGSTISNLLKNDLIRLLLLSPTFALGYKDAKEKRKLAEDEFNTYMAEKAAFEEKLKTPSELRGYRVAKVPTLSDIVKPAMAEGGRMKYNLGTEASMNAVKAAGIEGLPLSRNAMDGGIDINYTETGGFVPPVVGKEKKDRINALLADNEFVFTADAVRGMGDGDVNKGAERMYALMKKLENGGKV